MRLTNALAVITIGCMASFASAQDRPIPSPGDKPSALPGAARPGESVFHLEAPADKLHFTVGASHEKGAYLGVSTSPPAQALRQQLKLSAGTGLGVDFVEKGSPA